MIVWSPSSWALWKQCPAKYRIKKIERWQHPDMKPDRYLMRLAVPGLVVDRLLQFWIYRDQLDDVDWLTENFSMAWNMIIHQHHPKWNSDEELKKTHQETVQGLNNAVQMLIELDLKEYELYPQLRFFEKISSEYAITGAADLVLTDKKSGLSLLVDFKNAHYRNKVTKDQLIIYQIGIERTTDILIRKSGYLLFNPRVKEWKWFRITLQRREELLDKLVDATEQVEKGTFDFKWNHYSCTRYCDARFGCEYFQQLLKPKDQDNESPHLQNI